MLKRKSAASDASTIAAVRRMDSMLSHEQRATLVRWAHRLLEIKASGAPKVEKARLALLETRGAAVIFPIIKTIARDMKVSLWNRRSWAARAGLSAGAVTALVVGGQGAGIAALGGAIGVPLWVVFGAGGVFVGALIEELSKSLTRSSTVQPETNEPIEEAEWFVLDPSEQNAVIGNSNPESLQAPPKAS